MRSYLLVLLVAAAVTYVCTPIARLFARRLDIFTPLRERDVHTTPIPRLGGVAMFLGVCSGMLFASQVRFLEGVFQSNEMWGVLGAAGVIVLLGVADDIWDIDFMLKFGGQILAAGIMAWSGIQLTSLPVGGIILGSSTISIALTIFLVVLTVNAMNFVDGLDGLAAGVAGIGGLAFFAYAYLFTRNASPDDYSNTATLIVAIMVGACVGFLPHNFFPAKIFMGDTGSMLLGLMLAGAAIAITGQVDPSVVDQTELMPAFMPVLLPVATLCLPLMDLFLAVLRRTRAGKSPFSPDKKHMHHKMLGQGYSHPQAVLVLYLWAAVIAMGTVAFAFFDPLVVILADLAFVAAAILVTLRPWDRGGVPDDDERPAPPHQEEVDA